MTSVLDNNPEAGGIVVVAASAGGIDALIHLTAGLPAGFPAPVVIVQHLRAGERETRLPQILGRQCILPVQLARDGLEIRPGHVYLAQPGYHLKLDKQCLRLDEGPPVQYVRPAADPLFESAARQHGAAVIGLVLTGSGRDGTAGCRAIKAAGGTVIAQDEASAFNFRMPGSAIAAGCVDHVLPLEEIAGKLAALLGEPIPEPGAGRPMNGEQGGA